MNRLLHFLLVSLLTLTGTQAQDCLGIALKPGMHFDLSTFSGKDKPTGKIIYQVKDVRKEGGSTVMTMTAQFEDEKGKQQAPYDIKYTCTGDELTADLSGMAQSMQNTAMKDAVMNLKANQLVYPGKLSVGQKLADGRMEVDFVNNGSTMMAMNMTLSNRQVESQQPLTTPAGSFDTYKVASDMSFENRMMGIPIRGTMRIVSYRATNQLIDIKSETYNKSGKLMGYTLLTKVY